MSAVAEPEREPVEAPFFSPEKETERSLPAPANLVEHGARRAFVVLGIMLAVLLEILDTTIVNVALPTIQGTLGASLDDAAWIVTAYLIAVIVALPLVPWFESLLGRKRYCIVAIAGFTLASAACGSAQTLEQIVTFRVVQGLCGGGILTIARSILRDTFPPEQIGRSQALLALGAVVGPSVGPTLGGILTDAVSWRWIFFINVVPGIAAVAMLSLYLREPARPKVSNDVAGLAFMVVGLASLQYVLERGERADWFSDTGIVALAIVGALFTTAFAVWEVRFARDPIVDLRILRRPPVAIGSALSFGIGFTLFVGIVLGPQFSQSVLGFTATLSGNQVLLRAISIAAFIPVAVIGMTRLQVHPKFLIALGFALVGWSCFLSDAVTTSQSDFWSFGWSLAIGGFGFGLLFVPLSVAVLSSVPPADTTKASAMLSIAQQLGASVSTAVMVTVVDRRAATHFDHLAADASLHRAAVRAFVQSHHSVQALAQIVAREAETSGFGDAYFVSGVCALVLVPLALAYPARPPRPATSVGDRS